MLRHRHRRVIHRAGFTAALVIAAFVIGGLGVAWCAPNTGMQGRTWVLKGYGLELTPVKGHVTLKLENGKASGSGGINSFSGEYAIDDGTLTIGPLTSTMMAGDPDLMQQERTYLDSLQKARAFSVGPYRLALSDGHGKPLLLFEPLGVSDAHRPIIHAPTSGEHIGANVTVAGRTGNRRSGLISISTDVYVNGVWQSTVPGHRGRSTPTGKYWLRVATPLPAIAPAGHNVLYIVRVVELDESNQPRGPEAFVILYPER